MDQYSLHSLILEMPICPASFDGVGKAWYHDEGIRERILDKKGCLVLPEIGESSPLQSQGCCVLNRAFLIPLIKTMRTSKTLITPSLEIIREQVEELWITHRAAKQRKNIAGKGKWRFPKLDPHLQLDDETLANAHSDAKGIKTLLCFARKQFLSERVAKESPLQHACLHACDMCNLC